MTEQVEQQICIQFYVKLEHSSSETIWMTQKATAMGKWWLAVSSWQCAHSCITSLAESFGKTSDQPGDSVPLQPRFGTLWLLAFPKTKITVEREEISDHWWDSGKYDGAADGDWENCEVPRCHLWRGLRCHCPMYNISCIFFNKCLFFILHGWIPSGQTIYTYIDTDIYLFIYFLHPKGALTNYIK